MLLPVILFCALASFVKPHLPWHCVSKHHGVQLGRAASIAETLTEVAAYLQSHAPLSHCVLSSGALLIMTVSLVIGSILLAELIYISMHGISSIHSARVFAVDYLCSCSSAECSLASCSNAAYCQNQ